MQNIVIRARRQGGRMEPVTDSASWSSYSSGSCVFMELVFRAHEQTFLQQTHNWNATMITPRYIIDLVDSRCVKDSASWSSYISGSYVFMELVFRAHEQTFLQQTHNWNATIITPRYIIDLIDFMVSFSSDCCNLSDLGVTPDVF
jgi:hypothetical protein